MTQKGRFYPDSYGEMGKLISRLFRNHPEIVRLFRAQDGSAWSRGKDEVDLEEFLLDQWLKHKIN